MSTPTPPGPHLGARFRMVRALTQGASSALYEAEDIETGGLVAFKWLRVPGAAESTLEQLAALAREARRVVHPQVSAPVEVVREGDSLMVVSPLLAGEPYARMLAPHQLGLDVRLSVLMAAARAVAAAHDAGVLHLGLHPDNLFLLERPSAPLPNPPLRVLDFGVNRTAGAQLTRRPREVALGQHVFMAPEQLEGCEPTTSSDLFACAALFYQALTGHLPYPAPTTDALIAVFQSGREPTPANTLRRDLPRGLTNVLHACLGRRPETRPTRLDALLEQMERYLRTVVVPRPSVPPPVPAAALAAAAVTPGAGANFTQNAARGRSKLGATAAFAAETVQPSLANAVVVGQPGDDAQPPRALEATDLGALRAPPPVPRPRTTLAQTAMFAVPPLPPGIEDVPPGAPVERSLPSRPPELPSLVPPSPELSALRQPSPPPEPSAEPPLPMAKEPLPSWHPTDVDDVVISDSLLGGPPRRRGLLRASRWNVAALSAVVLLGVAGVGALAWPRAGSRAPIAPPPLPPSPLQGSVAVPPVEPPSSLPSAPEPVLPTGVQAPQDERRAERAESRSARRKARQHRHRSRVETSSAGEGDDRKSAKERRRERRRAKRAATSRSSKSSPVTLDDAYRSKRGLSRDDF